MWKFKRKDKSQVTTNLCNEFLIEHLIKIKRNCERNGMDRKLIIYNNAITNIKKYPLPIVSPTQLKSIAGVGEFLCD